MPQGLGTEDSVVAGWIYTTLFGDATLLAATPGGVHDGVAPDLTPYPLVSFDMMSSITVAGVGMVEIMQNQLWIVRAVNEGSDYVPCIAPMNRVHALLHGRSAVSVTGGTIESCWRVQQLRQQPVQGGREIRVIASIFRIAVQGT